MEVDMLTTAMAAGGQGKPAVFKARLLAESLGVSLLGVPLTADLYARNGFRLVGAFASSDETALEKAIQKFRNLQRLSPQAALRQSIPIGYDSSLCREDVVESVARLKEPRHRLVCELFWPHLSEERIAEVQSAGRLDCDSVITALEEGAKRSDREGALAGHALAVVLQNRALAEELDGRDTSELATAWPRALDRWVRVVESDPFWAHVHERAEWLDDPRVRPADVEAVREQLPIALLGWHQLFVAAYSRESRQEDIHRHFRFMHDSGFAKEPKRTAVMAAVNRLAKTRLEPLIDGLREATSGTGKLSRQAAREALNPVLGEALALRQLLASELGNSGDELEVAEFDVLAEEGLRVVSGGNLDYGDEQPRTLLFSVVSTRKLLSLPLSKPMRRRVQSELQTDIGHLYRGFMPDWAGTDPARCWFLKLEEADSEAALLLPVYKITSVKGGTVHWESRQVVVPRSERARSIHEGRLGVSDFASLPDEVLDPESRRLATQIRNAEAEMRTAMGDEFRAMDAEVQLAEEDLARSLGEYNRRVASQVALDKAHLDEVTRRYEALLTTETESHRQTIAAERQQAAGPIAGAEKAYREVVEANRAFKGLFQVNSHHLAMLLAIYCPFAAAAGFWLPRGSAIASVIGITLLLLGYLAAARSRRVAIARIPVEKAKAALVAKEDKLNLEHLDAKSRLAKREKEDGAEAAARLAHVEAERARLRGDAATRIDNIRRACQAVVREVEQRTADEVAELHERLAARIKPRPESEKTAFPGYRKALSAGYRDGTRPSEAEIRDLAQREMREFMNALSSADSETLSLLFRVLDSDQTDQLIQSLMELPPAARSEHLRDLRRRLFNR